MDEIIGENIKKLRIKSKQGQSVFWENYKKTQSAGTLYEQGKRQIPTDILGSISSDFKITIDELYGRTPKVVSESYDSQEKTIPIFIAGYVQAGSMTEHPIKEDSETLLIDKAFLHKNKLITNNRENRYVALNVRGGSMEKAGIPDGSVVICNRNISLEQISNDDIVVARDRRDRGKFTLKKFYIKEGIIMLVPCSDDHYPMPFQAKDIEIWGKAVVILRKI